ncbi:MAG: GTP pyrophosphokinase, partial [Lachnospiraceae bacterium]|nr:GTP pyrophosphokinase [Lachnospiraceae bacterium]
GYRSIHIIAEVPACESDILLEIQVCSAAMNYWAMLDHQLSYKNSRGDPEKVEKIEQELKSYAYDIANIDKKFLKIRKAIEKL